MSSGTLEASGSVVVAGLSEINFVHCDDLKQQQQLKRLLHSVQLWLGMIIIMRLHQRQVALLVPDDSLLRIAVAHKIIFDDHYESFLILE